MNESSRGKIFQPSITRRGKPFDRLCALGYTMQNGEADTTGRQEQETLCI
jgi:hypothetical protein